MKTLSKKISASFLLIALVLILLFSLAACTPEGKVLYRLTHVSFDVEDTSADPEFPRRASEDVQLNYYSISAGYASVYNSDLKLLSLTSRSNGTDKLADLPSYAVSSKPYLYFYDEGIRVNLNIHVKLKMENYSYMNDVYQNNSNPNGSKYYNVGTGLGKLEIQQDGSYLLKILIFNQEQSYNGNTFHNATYIILRFEKAN